MMNCLFLENAYIISESGDVSEIKPKNGTDFSLEEAQQVVDGHIEVVNLNDKQIMIVNEDGKFTKDINQLATAIARANRALFNYDFISGDVILCPSEMLK